MKALILAAGQGTRLYPETNSKPKCLVDIGGSTILAHQLRRCDKAGLDEAVVITGFQWQQVETEIANIASDLDSLKVSTVYNPFFDVSNNLATLWSARHVMGDAFISINGDDVFDVSILKRLRADNSQPILVSIDQKDAYDDDDMKILLDGKRITAINKKIPLAQAQGESIGIMKFRAEGVTRLQEELESMIRTETGLSDWYTKSIERIAQSGFPVAAFDIEGAPWAEIDFPEDLEYVRTHLQDLVRG